MARSGNHNVARQLAERLGYDYVFGNSYLCLDHGPSPEQRGRQMADVVEQLAAQDSERPTIVGGDWNTTTYDTRSLSGLLWSLTKKVRRGGFPHAIHHYTHPELLYERPVFTAIRQGKLRVEEFNAAAVGTTRYEVGDRDAESQVIDHLPRLAVELLRWKLTPWNGVVPLKLDWFAARGVRALSDGELRDATRRSTAPCVFERPETRRTTSVGPRPDPARRGAILLMKHRLVPQCVPVVSACARCVAQPRSRLPRLRSPSRLALLFPHRQPDAR